MSSALQTHETSIRRWFSRRRPQRLAISTRKVRSWFDLGTARVATPGDRPGRSGRRPEDPSVDAMYELP